MSTNALTNRDKILTAAQNLILREGFHSITVDKIIAAANISKGSFFYHFRSKDELPSALLALYLEEQGAEIREVFARAPADAPPLARVIAIIDGVGPIFARQYQGQPGCVMASFAYQLLAVYPSIRAISLEALSGWQSAFSLEFEPLCRERPAGPTPESLARQLMYCLQGANVVARVEGRAEAVYESVEHFKAYLTVLFDPAHRALH